MRLVHDPEKLLLPGINNFRKEKDNEIDEFDSGIQNLIMAGQSIFQAALSRSSINIVERYNALQDNPSKIHGMLHFCVLGEEDESEEWQAAASVDIDVQDADAKNLDMYFKSQVLPTAYKFGNSTNEGILQENEDMSSADQRTDLCPDPTTLLFSTGMKDPAITHEDNWDTFPWSNGSPHRIHQNKFTRLQECMEENCKSYTKQCTDALNRNVKFSSGKDLEDTLSSSSVEVFMPRAAPTESLTSLSDCRLESCERKGQNGHAVEISVNKDSHEHISSIIEEFAVHCEGPVEPQPQHGNISPPNLEERRNNGEAQANLSHKRRLALDELITGAVMAECQLQRHSFCHQELEPLSRILSVQMSALCQQQKTNKIFFKDLVVACSSGLNLDHDRNITFQRYFMALLSLAHQQNIGDFKNTEHKGFQLLLEKSSSGRISEILVSLVPHSQKRKTANSNS